MNKFRLKGTSGPVINKAVVVTDNLVIGSDESCDIRLEETGIEARHSAIEVSEDGVPRLRHVASAGATLCNGEPVRVRRLEPGDEIRVGTCRWLFQAPGLRPDRVLSSGVERAPVRWWPWLLLVGAAAMAALAWQRGWLPF